jgi:hypothetical protein
MSEMTFVKGDFQAFRALTKVHLGSLGENLEVNEVVLFDGSVLRRGGQDHPFPALRGAIKVNWLVPDGQAGTYAPKAADIQVGDAVSRGEKRELRPVKVQVAADEQDVGNLQKVRGPDAPVVHHAKNAGKQADGVVVAKIKTPAKATAVEIGTDDRRVVNELDNKSRIAIEKVAIAGDELTDIIGDAAETGKPSAGLAGEGRGDESELRARAVTASGSSSVGGQDDGVVLRSAARVASEAVTAEIPRITLSTPISSLNLEVLDSRINALGTKIDTILRILAQMVPATPDQKVYAVTPSTPDADDSNIDEGLVDAQAEWDMNLHWKVRVKKAVELYASDPDRIDEIREIETPAVVKAIDEAIARLRQGASHHNNGVQF